MPDPGNPFDAVYKAAPTSGATVNGSAPSGPNPFDAVYGGKAAPAQATAGDPQHGSLYNAASSILNSTSPQANTGNPTLDKVANGIDYVGDQVAGMGQGAIKGALSTAAGIGSVFNRVTGSKQPFNQDNLRDLTVAHGPGQSLGKGAEQVGEFATGEGAAVKGAEALNLTGKAAKLAPGFSKVLASGAASGAQSGGDPLQTTLGTALPAVLSSPVVKVVGKSLAKMEGMLSGGSAGAISRAFLNSDSNGLAQVMRGKMTVNDVLGNFQNKVQSFRDDAAATYAQRLDKISNTQVKDWPTKAGNFMSDIDYTLTNELKKFGVVQHPNGAWDFRQLSPSMQESEVKELIDTVYNHGTRGDARDMTPAGLDRLKKAIGTFVDKGGSMSALGSRLYDRANKGLGDIINGYSQMTGDYAKSQELLRQLKSEYSISPSNLSNAGVISRKLQNLFNQNTDYKELLMKKIPGGEDLLDQVAGLHLQDVLPKGTIAKFMGYESMLAFLHNPMIMAHAAPIGALMSPRFAGETARAMGKVAASGVPVRDAIRRGLLAGTNSQ